MLAPFSLMTDPVPVMALVPPTLPVLVSFPLTVTGASALRVPLFLRLSATVNPSPADARVTPSSLVLVPVRVTPSRL